MQRRSDQIKVHGGDLSLVEILMRVIGLAGWSGSGKTTLLTKLIPVLRARGLSVSTVKHAHHAFDIDTPGKDSWAHREAGATEVLVSSARRFALMRELREASEWTLAQLLTKLSPVDLVIVEGFKKERHAKIEVWRAVVGMPPLAKDDPAIRAIATSDPIAGVTAEKLDLDDVDKIAGAVLRHAEPVAEVMLHLSAPPSPLAGEGGLPRAMQSIVAKRRPGEGD